MPKPKKGPRYGGSPKHHNMIVANLATELFRHGRIRTTKSKAKTMQPVAERMITFAKRGDLHARRQVLTVIRDKDVVHKLFADIGPAAANRNGGYTRVTPIGPRKGDNAPMAVIELVDTVLGDEGENALTEAPRRRWSLRRQRTNLSRSAREREEAIMAAEDAGVDTYEVPEDADEAGEDEAVEAARITERNLAAAAEAEEEGGPEVRPEDVEARFADEDQASDAEDTDAEDTDAEDTDAKADADEPDSDEADSEDEEE